jgi:hypothetical protein
LAQTFEHSPSSKPRVAAHLIVGPREEPFLAALCRSLEGACETLIVNDNAPDPSPHAAVLAASAFAKAGRLIVDRTPFEDFSAARNICMRLHAQRGAGEWIAFVDADEVHGPQFQRIAHNLECVPAGTDFVDGYTWHFFQSFDWYMSIERRMSFFRFRPDVRWEGRVHEQLRGLDGARIALPYVYAHYGWLMPAHHHARKGRQYLSLGAAGRVLEEHEIDDVGVDTYFEFEHRWVNALRFSGAHPPAARETIARLRSERHADFARVDELVRAHQSMGQRTRNALMKLNYEMRWRGRALNPQARQLLG